MTLILSVVFYLGIGLLLNWLVEVVVGKSNLGQLLWLVFGWPLVIAVALGTWIMAKIQRMKDRKGGKS